MNAFDCIADILAAHGVERAVLSPGARCAPLSMAVASSHLLQCFTVVSEHTAAFMSLGMAVESGRPVVLVCTSGSALLNYAPALAEAYRRQIPLIVLSADRPAERIGQADGQTMVQPGALRSVVKRSIDVQAVTGSGQWLTRAVNEAISTAMTPPYAPVHLNIGLDPAGQPPEVDRPRVIRVMRPEASFTTAEARAIGAELFPPRNILVVAGHGMPDAILNKALLKLSHIPSLAIACELYANIHVPGAVSITETLVGQLSGKMRPDVILTLGGSLVSNSFKKWLKGCTDAEHWHIGFDADMCDTFGLMTRRIEMTPGQFMRQLASAMMPVSGDCDPTCFAGRWRAADTAATRIATSTADISPWCDLKAVSIIGRLIPRGWNIQVSNGMSARYAMMAISRHQHRADCNRGISGIDGSTSTAVGAAMCYSGTTLLVSGDMSALHDSGPLAAGLLPAGFKMVIMANGGGNIFRCVDSTRSYDATPGLLCAEPMNVNWQALAAAACAEWFAVDSEESLRREWPLFAAVSDRAAIMCVNTDPQVDASAWISLLNRK